MVAKRNTFSIVIISMLAVIIILSIAFFISLLVKNFAIRKELNSADKILNDLVKQSKYPLTKEAVIFLADEHNRLKNIYSRYRMALESPLNEEVSKAEIEPLQFKERLIQTQKKLREDANLHKLTLPESLGFSEYETKLIELSEIPSLIKKLKVLEEIIYIAWSSGVDNVYEVNFNPGEKNKSGAGLTQAGKSKKGIVPELDLAKKEKDVYFDIPVFLRLGCSSQKLLNFLYRLRLSQFNFAVDNLAMEIKNEDGDKTKIGKLTVSMSIRTVALN